MATLSRLRSRSASFRSQTKGRFGVLATAVSDCYRAARVSSAAREDSKQPSIDASAADTLLLLGYGQPDPSGRDGPTKLSSFDTLTISNIDGDALNKQAGKYLAPVLNDGSFFYSRSEDCALRLAMQTAHMQRHKKLAVQPEARKESPPSSSKRPSPPTVEGRHVWNTFMLAPFVKLGEGLTEAERQILHEDFLLPLVRGFFGNTRVKHGSVSLDVRLISRRDWHREGTRFLKRGIDGAGDVAAFAETELRLRVLPDGGVPEHTVSFVLVRGSVPAYWTEKPRVSGQLCLGIAKDAVDVSLSPFVDHINHLTEAYGPVHAMAFLHGQPRGWLAAEAHLLQLYKDLVTSAQRGGDTFVEEMKLDAVEFSEQDLKPGQLDLVPGKIGKMVDAFLDQSGWTRVQGNVGSPDAVLVRKQKGVLRINCRDCCDRTNLGQFSCSAQAIRKILQELGLPPLDGSPLDQAHRNLWADNGNVLSRIYTGGNSMTANFIERGHPTLEDAVKNKANSVRRMRQALQFDDAKNGATEILTGEHKPHSGARACSIADLLVPEEGLPPLSLRLVGRSP
ncbi:hypothetical protein JCM10908_001233 [Rhodotorula pacifica]|uniref:uncharacterized protein n=1 Tax=Rhodotorula pacifica TaxID=1495444 RepID=UPI00316BB99B